MRRTGTRVGGVLLVLACLLPAGNRAAADERPTTGTAVPAYEPVDEAVRHVMDTIHCQAATVAISQGGKLLYSRGYGWRDAKRRVPTPPDALMRIASVSKPITAAEVKTLIREKKLTPDTRVFPLLGIKPYNGQEGDPRLDTITVHHLLEHEGGWDSHASYDPMFRMGDIKKALGLKGPPTPVNVIEYMLAQPLQFTPGERSAYSNFGYCVLGRVVEKVTGLPYGEAVRRDLLQPLGIKDMRLGRSAARDRDPREVWYPVPDDAYAIEVMDAHGGWVASAPALCQFLDAYWISGEPRQGGGGGELLFFGSLPGTTAMAHQRPDGINVVVLLNGRRDASIEADDELLRRSIDDAINRAAGEVRYAALWEKRPGPPWVAHNGMSADDYQKALDRYAGEGYRLTAVSGCGVGGAARYAAVWEKRPGPAWSAQHGLSADEYQKAFDRSTADGYRPTWISAYGVGGEARYAVIWEKRAEPAWAARHGLSAEEFQEACDRYRAEGFRPVVVSACEVGGAARYAAVWEKRDGPAWAEQHGLTEEEFQKALDKYTGDGYRPAVLNATSVGGEARYAAVWEKGPGRTWVARHGLSGDEFQEAFEKLGAGGYRLVSVSAFRAGGR